MNWAAEEFLAVTIARLIGDARHVAVGAASPIPASSVWNASSQPAENPFVR